MEKDASVKRKDFEMVSVMRSIGTEAVELVLGPPRLVVRAVLLDLGD
jgi:hypothetical protein